jgi:hypothetical protein
MTTRLNGKSRAWYCTVLTALLIAAVFCGCAGEAANTDQKSVVYDMKEEEENQTLGTWEGLSVETEKRILKDITSGIPLGDVDKISICGYYGTYNGCVVVSFRTPYPVAGVVWEAVIAGTRFFCGDISKVPLIWKDGVFYKGDGSLNGSGLQEAYDLGLLTQDDLRNIADLFNVL